MSQTTRDLVGSGLSTLVYLGEHRLKDLAEPIRLFNVVHAGMPDDLPPPRSLSVHPNNLPLQLTTFIGRDEEITKIRKLLDTTLGPQALETLMKEGRAMSVDEAVAFALEAADTVMQ